MLPSALFLKETYFLLRVKLKERSAFLLLPVLLQMDYSTDRYLGIAATSSLPLTSDSLI